jgi:hypothetical protein
MSSHARLTGGGAGSPSPTPDGGADGEGGPELFGSCNGWPVDGCAEASVEPGSLVAGVLSAASPLVASFEAGSAAAADWFTKAAAAQRSRSAAPFILDDCCVSLACEAEGVLWHHGGTVFVNGADCSRGSDREAVPSSKRISLSKPSNSGMSIRPFEARHDRAARGGEEVDADTEVVGVRAGGDQSDCPTDVMRYANNSEKWRGGGTPVRLQIVIWHWLMSRRRPSVRSSVYQGDESQKQH